MINENLQLTTLFRGDGVQHQLLFINGLNLEFGANNEVVQECRVRFTHFNNSGSGSSPSEELLVRGTSNDEFAVYASMDRNIAVSNPTERFIDNSDGSSGYYDVGRTRSERDALNALSGDTRNDIRFVPLRTGSYARAVLNNGNHAAIANVLSCTRL